MCSFPRTHLNVTEPKERLKNDRPNKKKTVCVDPPLLLKLIHPLTAHCGVAREGQVQSAENVLGGVRLT